MATLVAVAVLWLAPAFGGCGGDPSSSGDKARRDAHGNELVSAGLRHTVGLGASGRAVAAGDDGDGSCDVTAWSDLVAVSAGDAHTVGLRADGTAVAAGNDDYGQCDVSEWRDLVAVSAGGLHTVGLRADGTAVATGDDEYGQCDVSDWRDLVAVSAGGLHTVGLRADGSAVATGYNENRRCDVSDWQHIVAVSAGGFHTVGLRRDGTAVAAGTRDARSRLGKWHDLVAVSAGGGHTVGLRRDGTAVAAGFFEGGACDVGDWKDLVAVSAGFEHTVGLRRDGTVVAVGDPRFGQCDVGSWRLNGEGPASPPSTTGAPSSLPVVYLLDGSGAREAIVSNTAWADEIHRLGGPRVVARDMGVRNQTFTQDGLLVQQLPAQRALLLIGLSIGRFTGDPAEGSEGYDPQAVLRSTGEIDHLYSADRLLPAGEKRAALQRWLTEKGQVFDRTREANAAVLDRLVSFSRERGLRPVLVELPLDLDIVGSALDGRRAAYRRDVRRIAARHDIPYLDLDGEADLRNKDFFDLIHLVEPGRVKWQRAVSRHVVELLRQYGMDH